MSADDVDPVRRALERARAHARTRTRRAPERRRERTAEPGTGLTGPGPDLRDPQRLAAMIDSVVTDAGWAATMPVATLMGAWDRLVGPEIAAHCRPERLVDGELVLVAESTAWATQLRLLTRQVLAQLATELGPDVVRRLRVTGPATPSWSRGPRRVTGRGPRDTYG